MSKIKKIIAQRGAISIILAILLLNVVTVVGLTIALLIFQQLKMSGQTGRSVVAFYAANAGAERCLYRVRKDGEIDCPFTDEALDFDPNAMYTTVYNGSNQITSVGRFGITSRKVELSW